MEGMAIWARTSAPRGANRTNSPARAGAAHLSAELPVTCRHRVTRAAAAGVAATRAVCSVCASRR